MYIIIYIYNTAKQNLIFFRLFRLYQKADAKVIISLVIGTCKHRRSKRAVLVRRRLQL